MQYHRSILVILLSTIFLLLAPGPAGSGPAGADWEDLMTKQAKKEAGNSYMNIKERARNVEQQSGSDYIRMESKTSE